MTFRVIDLINAKNTVVEEVKPLTVEGIKVTMQDLSTSIDLIGNTYADLSVPILSPFPAKVLEIPVHLGDYVKSGDVLFTLDPSDLEAQITQAQFGVEQATNGLKLANLGIKNASAASDSADLAYAMAQSNYTMNLEKYEFAKNNLEKYEALYQDGTISQSEYEQMKLQASPETVTLLDAQLKQAEQSLSQAQLGKEQAQANVKQASIALEQANEGLKKAQEAVDDLEVTTSVEGYVTSIGISEQVIASNTQVAIMIEDLSTIKVTTSVTADALSLIKKGDTVKITITSLNKEVEGTVDSVALSADARTLLYPVVIIIDNKDLIIKPGMFATVHIISAKADQVLTVPSSAVLVRNGKHVVYVQTGETSAEERDVEIGVDTGFLVEIKNGLTIDDVVITKGVGLLENDTVITVVRGDE